jgi:hypothetical protein
MEITDEELGKITQIKISGENHNAVSIYLVEGNKFISMFNQISEIYNNQKTDDKEKYALLGISIIKINSQKDLETFKEKTMNVNYTVIQNSFGIFVVIKRFLISDSKTFTNSINSITNYFDVLFDSYLRVYGLNRNIVTNEFEKMFLMFEGKSFVSSNMDSSFNLQSKKEEPKETQNVNIKPVTQQPKPEAKKKVSDDFKLDDDDLEVKEPHKAKRLFADFVKYILGESWFDEHERKNRERKQKNIELYNKQLELEGKKLDLKERKLKIKKASQEN